MSSGTAVPSMPGSICWEVIRCLALRITDEGAGFDPGSVGEKGGLGLVSMQEAAHAWRDHRHQLATGEGPRIDVRLP